METVDLHPAHMWDCPHCGRENFCRGVVPELSEDEQAEMRDEHGIEPYDQGYWMSAPGIVTCKYCEREYKTNAFNPDEPDSGGANWPWS